MKFVINMNPMHSYTNKFFYMYVIKKFMLAIVIFPPIFALMIIWIYNLLYFFIVRN